jgi:molecular chaperone DnaK (HSP70)
MQSSEKMSLFTSVTLQGPSRSSSSSVSGASQATVLVGIDFGTTFSGVAFTRASKVDHIEIITSWESDLPKNSEEVKVPTAISHENGTVTWGYSIPPEVEPVRWFKLLLADRVELAEDVQRSSKLEQAREYLRKHNKTAISFVAEYLRLLWEHCEKRMIEAMGSVVKYEKLHVVITVPAIWSQSARMRMRDAAKEAGILKSRPCGETRLDIISEPEAAAMATLRDKSGLVNIKVTKRYTQLFIFNSVGHLTLSQVGDVFVVADCGGGTADLISYEVTCLSPLRMKECVEGEGRSLSLINVPFVLIH